jgi:hypothetical protein
VTREGEEEGVQEIPPSLRRNSPWIPPAKVSALLCLRFLRRFSGLVPAAGVAPLDPRD